MKQLSILIISLIFLSSCNQGNFRTNKTIKSAVFDYYQNFLNWNEGPITDFRAFVHYNRKEILNTLEIVEIKKIPEKNIAIAFTRFSIGTTDIRQAIWLRKVEDTWAKSFINPQNNIEWLGYKKKTSELEKILEKTEKWEEVNPEVWYLRYWN